MQHSLFIHTARVDAEGLLVFASPLAFVDVTVQTQYGLVFIEHCHHRLAAYRHQGTSRVGGAQILGQFGCFVESTAIGGRVKIENCITGILRLGR